MPLHRIRLRLKKYHVDLRACWDRRYRKKYDRPLSLAQIPLSFRERNGVYAYMHHFFNHLLPEPVRTHRKYFSCENRGFGEDAFHSLWYLLFSEFKPRQVLEIGIYRGQTLSLWALLAKMIEFTVEIHGISPLSAAGDANTRYPELDYLQDIKDNFAHFGLPLPFIHQGLSTDPDMVKLIQSITWDLIYIDGSHDYETVRHDFAICSKALKTNGLIVLDDAAKFTDYIPPAYAFAGHAGPSRVAGEIDSRDFQEIIGVGHNRVFQKKG